MNETELKPCPFCGGEAKTSWGTVDPDNKLYMGWIGCQNCRCFINYMNNNRGLKEAKEAWNRRADEKQDEELANLHDAISEFYRNHERRADDGREKAD